MGVRQSPDLWGQVDPPNFWRAESDMQTRRDLSARQVEALIERLRRRLESILPETQPEVASRLLELVQDPEAGPAEFADAVRHDPTLSGRLLRVANSAVFAQRSPVTTVERACVLLGLQRIRAIALGFYLARSAQAGPAELSRRIWGESVFRACLASTLGVARVPGASAEAFLIGLMLDTGIPLLRELAGPAYDGVLDAARSPRELMRLEIDRLPCTHVDVVSALCRIWELPDVLRKPIERHHIRPRDGDETSTLTRLHQIAHVVGEIDLTIRGDALDGPVELSRDASALLGMDGARLREAVDSATGEYTALIDVFSDVAEGLRDLDAVRELAHARLVESADAVARESFNLQQQFEPQFFAFRQGRVQIDSDRALGAIAYLIDSRGDALVSYSFNPGNESARTLLDALGIDAAETDRLEPLDDYLRGLAA